MAKKSSSLIKNLKISKKPSMEYTINIKKAKDRIKFIKRIERMVRSSLEYKDYIKFLKENIGLDSCIFFQNVTNNTQKRGRISIEIHHEPFTLFDIVDCVLRKYEEEGYEINDLLIADEVMELHYKNKVGLVPLSKTAHQIIHNSVKLFVPLNMVYGQYSEFLNEYEPYVSDEMYEKLEEKMSKTKNLTPESFDAITLEFKYIETEGVHDVEKVELQNKLDIA